MLNKPLIIGANGQLGRALADIMPQADALIRTQCDMTQVKFIPEILASYKPSIIINASAYTAVDKAEDQEPIAHLVNAEAPAVLAAYCAAEEIPLIHFSTDYVFDGHGEHEWTEDHTPSPLNAYGKSKLKGEEMIMASDAKAMIFRTSWVYDAYGKNFVATMLRLGKEREELSVVHDQVGCPTYAPHLAKATTQAMENALKSARFPTGIYHLSGQGAISWHDFAESIFSEYKGELKVKTVKRILTEEYPTPATRPLNSRLDCSKARDVLGIELPHWHEGLLNCLKVIRAEETADD